MLTKQCSIGMTLVSILAAPISLSARLNDPSTNAVSLARKALDAMGGEQNLWNLETVPVHAWNANSYRLKSSS
jgi:hypothetical protein